MYIKNDICYASERVDEIRINYVKPLAGRMLLVLFNNGEQKLFDTTKLTGSVFQELDNDAIFNNPVLFHGIVTWNDGEIDIAPETIYEEGIPYENDNDIVLVS